jgi:hypothetical protein
LLSCIFCKTEKAFSEPTSELVKERIHFKGKPKKCFGKRPKVGEMCESSFNFLIY